MGHPTEQVHSFGDCVQEWSPNVTKILKDRGTNALFDVANNFQLQLEDKAIKPGSASLGGRVNEL